MKLGAILRNGNLGAELWPNYKVLNFAFEIRVNVFRVAIRAFNKAFVLRDHQPNAWMPQSSFAAVAGELITFDNFCFRRLCRHRCVPFSMALHYLPYERSKAQGQDTQ